MILKSNLILVILLLSSFNINAQEKLWEFPTQDAEYDLTLAPVEYNAKGGMKDKTFIFVLHDINEKRIKKFKKQSEKHYDKYVSQLERLNKFSEETAQEYWNLENDLKFMTSSEVETMSKSEQEKYAYIYISLGFVSKNSVETPFSIKGIGLKTSPTTYRNAVLLPLHNLDVSKDELSTLDEETLKFILSYGILMIQDRLQNVGSSNLKHKQYAEYKNHLKKDGYPIIRKKTLCFIGSQEDLDKMDFKREAKLINLKEAQEILSSKNNDYTILFQTSWFEMMFLVDNTLGNYGYVILDAETGNILFEEYVHKINKMLKSI